MNFEAGQLKSCLMLTRLDQQPGLMGTLEFSSEFNSVQALEPIGKAEKAKPEVTELIKR